MARKKKKVMQNMTKPAKGHANGGNLGRTPQVPGQSKTAKAAKKVGSRR